MPDIATIEGVRYLLGLQELVRAPEGEGPEPAFSPSGGSAPTIVIAASNTSFRTQLKADYVSGTPDASETFLTALQDLRFRGGGRLVLCEGYYGISAMFPIDFHLRVEGMGMASVVQVMPGSVIGAGFQIVGQGASSHCSFSDFWLDGNKAFATSGTGIIWGGPIGTFDNLLLNRMLISNWDGDGLNWQRVGGTTMISDCQFISNSGTGALVLGEGHHLITNSLSRNNGGAGFNITGSLVVLHGNRAIDNAAAGITHGGFLSAGQNLIVGNRVSNNGLSGIDMNAALFAGQNVIVGNLCASNGAYGITCGGTDGQNDVVGNVVVGNTLSGIFCSLKGGACSGNMVAWNGQHGIALINADDWVVSSNSIRNNSQTTNNTYDGIYVDTDSDENLITTNRISQEPTAGQGHRYGINIANANCDANAVIGNDCRGGFRTGVTGYNDVGTGTVNLWAGVFGDNL